MDFEFFLPRIEVTSISHIISTLSSLHLIPTILHGNKSKLSNGQSLSAKDFKFLLVVLAVVGVDETETENGAGEP